MSLSQPVPIPFVGCGCGTASLALGVAVELTGCGCGAGALQLGWVEEIAGCGCGTPALNLGWVETVSACGCGKPALNMGWVETVSACGCGHLKTIRGTTRLLAACGCGKYQSQIGTTRVLSACGCGTFKEKLGMAVTMKGCGCGSVHFTEVGTLYNSLAGILGFAPDNPTITQTTWGMTPTSTWLAYGFTLPAGKTLQKAAVFMASKTGSPLTTDLAAQIQTDNVSKPSGSNVTGGGAVNPASWPASSGWLTFSGWSAALSQNTQYWLVLKGTNSVGYGTFGIYPSVTPFQAFGSQNIFGFLFSTASAGTWSLKSNASGCLRLTFSDGTSLGMPLGAWLTQNDPVYTTHEYGVKFTSPANNVLRVAGAAFCPHWAGATRAPLGYKLRVGANAPVTATTLPSYNGAVEGWFPLYFSSVVVVPQSTVCRLTIYDPTNALNVSNYATAGEYGWEPSADGKTLRPFGSNTVITSTANGGTSWTDNARDALMPFAVILDPGT